MSDYYDLGTYSRPVTTRSAQAQRWFDRGLLWRYAFHHEESVRCFRSAAPVPPHHRAALARRALPAGDLVEQASRCPKDRKESSL